jgi:hypothetical protein
MTRITSIILGLVALLAVPSVSEAATTFGSRLKNEPTDGECKNLVAPCTYAAFIHPSDPDGDPYAGGAPVDGVITKFRIRAYGPGAQVTFRLANVTAEPNSESALATAAGTGPTVTINGTPDANNEIGVEEFPASLPVKKGNQLAIDTSEARAIYNSNGNKYTYVFAPTLMDGQGQRGSSDVTNELLVQADIEPDVDGDGLGDETQDPNVGPEPTTADSSKPRLRGLKLSRKALSYRLSEKARVSIKIKKGRRTVRKLSDAGEQGLNKVSLGRKLALGRYRVVIKATDTAGNKTAPRRVKLSVR